MPGAVPELRLAAARVELENLLSRVPEAVFSCPKRIADQPQVPNPCFGGWESAGHPEHGVGPGRAAYAAGRRASRGWETLDDPAPPFTERRIPGGAATLKLQAADPAQAFCVARLKARPLNVPVRGIDARLRGLLLHRVLELALAPGPHGTEASPLPSTIDRVFAESVARGDERWDQLVSAEKQRTRALLERFLALEGQRQAYVTLDVERSIDVEIAGRVLAGRIDRRDRVDGADGGCSWLIDYKTGRQSSSGWFNDRLTDPQLPLYAQLAGESPGGIVIVALGADGVAYRAAGIGVDELPGRQRNFEPEAWREQLEHWRRQLIELVEEFSRGDVRVRVDDGARTGQEFAVLTRSRDARR
jgi:RecB family exonuclease